MSIKKLAERYIGKQNRSDSCSNIPVQLEWVEKPCEVGTVDEHDHDCKAISGVLRNRSLRPVSFQVVISIYDADGHQLKNLTDSMYDLLPGNTWKFTLIVPENAYRWEFVKATCINN